MNRSGTNALLIIAAPLLAGGCTVGPNYKQPETTAPPAWSVKDQGGITDAPVTQPQWWLAFNDPQLNGLVDQAASANLDLAIATALVREARAQRGVVAADAYPQVNVGASYERSRQSENGFSGGNGFGRAGQDTNLYHAGFDAAWEIDIFGRVRRSVEAADANIGVAVENRRDVMVTLVAEVARNYVDLRGAQRRLAIVMKNVESQQQTVEISEARLKAGLTGELDSAQAKALLATTQSEIPSLETEAQLALHALAILLGREPNALAAELTPPQPIPGPPPSVPVGVPSDTLRRRPDVRSAERALEASTAEIGVATADLFPRFSLTGTYGFSAQDAAKLFTSASQAYSLGPAVTWPIFDAGRIKANIRVKDARQEQALAQYQLTVLTSLKEVEDALVAYWKEQARRQSLAEAVASSQRAVDLSNELYSRGLTDFLNVLVNQRSLFQTEDQLVQSDRNVSANFIAVCKALGGGWEAFEETEVVAAKTD